MVAIHYYGWLAAKQGWRFDSTYDHKDEAGDPTPFVFALGSEKKVDYPLELDDFCSDELRQKLQAPRQILRDSENAKLGLKAQDKNSGSKENDVSAPISEAGLGGLSFDEGQFSVFGYTTIGREVLSQIKSEDLIRSAKLVDGRDRLILPADSDRLLSWSWMSA